MPGPSFNILKASAAALRLALQNGALYFYGNSSIPASTNDAPIGTVIGIASVGGLVWTPGNVANGCTLDAPVIENHPTYGNIVSLKKPTGQLWQFTAIAAGTVSWARYVGNPIDNFLADPTGLLARYDMTVSSKTGSGAVKLDKLTYAVGETGNIASGMIWLKDALMPAV